MTDFEFLFGSMACRMNSAETRYGPFASTHEALGVASEEWDELREAIHSNDFVAIESECIDLAAVLMRLAEHIHDQKLRDRSVK